jgi:hypothetical protein
MKIFRIIPYWINTETGETREKKDCIYLKIGNNYDEVFNWAKNNKDNFSFNFLDVYSSNEISENNLKFGFSIKESTNLIINDIAGNEYKIAIKPVSKIEIPIE